MHHLRILTALCLASSACSAPLPGAPTAEPAADEPAAVAPPARMAAMECTERARNLKERLVSLCASYRALGVPEGMKLPADDVGEPVVSRYVTVNVSALGYSLDQDEGWSRDTSTLDTNLSNRVRQYVREQELMQRDASAEYLIIGDAQAPTALVIDAMRLMAARGHVEVLLGGGRSVPIPEEFSPDVIARGESVRSIEDDGERKKALQVLDDDVSGGCAAVAGVVVDNAEVNYELGLFCLSLRMELSDMYQRCDCDPAVDPYRILASALGAPPSIVVSQLVTFAPGGVVITLDPARPWAESREALLAVDGPIAPLW